MVRAPPLLRFLILFDSLPVERLDRDPVVQGLMWPQVIVGPEVVSQAPSGLDRVDVDFSG